MKNSSIEYVLLVSEIFNPNINLPMKRKLITHYHFLFIRNSEYIHTTVNRKESNNDSYLHCHAFVFISWKRGILIGPILSAQIITIYSNKS